MKGNEFGKYLNGTGGTRKCGADEMAGVCMRKFIFF